MVTKKQTGFGEWRWVHHLSCSQCKQITKVLGNNTKHRPDLPPGAILCSCGGKIFLRPQ